MHDVLNILFDIDVYELYEQSTFYISLCLKKSVQILMHFHFRLWGYVHKIYMLEIVIKWLAHSYMIWKQS